MEVFTKGVPVTPLGKYAQLFGINIESKASTVFRVYALAVLHNVFAE